MMVIQKKAFFIPGIQPVPSKKRVAAYARVSDTNEGLLHSMSAQVSYYSKLIQNNPGWEYSGVYADEGVSGRSTKKRTEFMRLMADCEAGRVDLILTKSVSRFARDTVDCLKWIRHLKEIGVEVRFERENISTFSMDGELLLTLLASFAQAESEAISANIRWATRKRFEKGIPNGHRPLFGYRWDGEMYRIVPEEGEAVKYIFKEYLAGKPAYTIAKALAEKGIAGKKGIPLDDSVVKDILSNISYTGPMVLQKYYISESRKKKTNNGELYKYVIDGMYEPLVSKDDFTKAQEIRAQRASLIPEATILGFSGLVKCGSCGSGVSRRTSRAAKRWCCNTKERKGTCDMRPIMEEELIAAVESICGGTDNATVRERITNITIYGDRVEMRLADKTVRCVKRKYDGQKGHNGFSGKLYSGLCGTKCLRKTWTNAAGEKLHGWICTASNCVCGLVRVREDEIRRSAEQVLKTTEYEAAVVEQIRAIRLYNDRFEYDFKDGSVTVWNRG
jgi:Site-specific recombinases, DNA invertase Pin homologs